MNRWATLDGSPTKVIAHRGASGLLPEHTLAAYALAAQQGADLIEPDLVCARDGTLMVRHERELSRSTDIAVRPQFAHRRRAGEWWVEQFGREELAQLRAVQPVASRDRSHDGQWAVPDFDQVLAWAQDLARSRGVATGLYPELKHVSWFERLGLDPVARFLDAVVGIAPDRVAFWVQCFEPAPLRRVRDASGLPTFLLLEREADWRAALAQQGRDLAGLGVAKSLLHDPKGRDAGLVAAAHARGLQVHAWTYRDDSPADGSAQVEEELEAAFALGVDAVFCDFPATALALRARRA